jgi:hypothetical protein
MKNYRCRKILNKPDLQGRPGRRGRKQARRKRQLSHFSQSRPIGFHLQAYITQKASQVPMPGNLPKKSPVQVKKGQSNALYAMHEIPHMLI